METPEVVLGFGGLGYTVQDSQFSLAHALSNQGLWLRDKSCRILSMHVATPSLCFAMKAVHWVGSTEDFLPPRGPALGRLCSSPKNT